MVKLIDFLKRCNSLIKIDLFNDNCSLICCDCTRTELLDFLRLKYSSNFSFIIYSDLRFISINNGVFELQLSHSFDIDSVNCDK